MNVIESGPELSASGDHVIEDTPIPGSGDSRVEAALERLLKITQEELSNATHVLASIAGVQLPRSGGPIQLTSEDIARANASTAPEMNENALPALGDEFTAFMRAAAMFGGQNVDYAGHIQAMVDNGQVTQHDINNAYGLFTAGLGADVPVVSVA